MTISNLARAFGLEDQICVVTGGAQALGRGVALALAQEGAVVAVLDEDLTGALETVAKIRHFGGRAEAFACDTTNKTSIENARSRIESAIGSPEVLVNSAQMIGVGPISSLSQDRWDALLAANLTGYLLCSQTFGIAMRERGRGAIVHIGSIAAEKTKPMAEGFGIAMAGVTMLSRTLAAEWGKDGVRSNVVHPGIIEEPTPRQSSDSGISALTIPIGRLGQPEDVAQAVLFLASKLASYINGTELLVDGGLARNLTAIVPRVP